MKNWRIHRARALILYTVICMRCTSTLAVNERRETIWSEETHITYTDETPNKPVIQFWVRRCGNQHQAEYADGMSSWKDHNERKKKWRKKKQNKTTPKNRVVASFPFWRCMFIFLAHIRFSLNRSDSSQPTNRHPWPWLLINSTQKSVYSVCLTFGRSRIWLASNSSSSRLRE